jgi:hypothetical protein
MQIGLKFANGLQLAFDLGDRINAKTVGAVIRFAGARAAAQIRRSTDRVAAHTVERMERRKAKRK